MLIRFRSFVTTSCLDTIINTAKPAKPSTRESFFERYINTMNDLRSETSDLAIFLAGVTFRILAIANSGGG